MKAAEASLRWGTPKGRDLSLVIDFWVSVAFVTAMAICASVEYVRSPDMAVRDILAHHLVELVLYGCLLWGITWLVLRAVLIRPIQQICHHLYKVGGGDPSPLIVASRVREIQNIVEGINVMVWRLERQADRKALASARDRLAGIQDSIRGGESLDPEAVTNLLADLSAVEQHFRDVGHIVAIRDAGHKRGQHRPLAL